MTPAVVLDRVLRRWRARLPATYSAEVIDGFIRRNRPALETVVDRAMKARSAKRGSVPDAGSPRWFEHFNPRGGVPRESLPGYRRATAAAAAIFDRALSLLDEEPSDLDLRPALEVLGSREDDEIEFDYDEALELAAELPILLGAIDWTPEEAGDLLAAMLDTQARGGIVSDELLRAQITERIWDAEQHLELRSIGKDQACESWPSITRCCPTATPEG